MDEQIFEGTWEEVATHADEFAGKHVRLTVVEETPPSSIQARLEVLRQIDELRKEMPMTDGSDSQRMLREARAGAMWGYEPIE
ncbi:MAG: hypothetical protein HYR56_01825 [Acidobacteria bacterium]|nr:hypothetical protein [Acidobacteriota bacterium]MBI3421989.1 hypothetical protein [Acidobacteriota bacterium]